MKERHFFLLLTLLLPLLSIAQSNERTEEYAVISAWQAGRRTFISVTVGSTPTPEKEFEAEKGEKRFDLSPVIREMEALNAMGFELVSGGSTNMTSGGGQIATAGVPFYTFVFKRRLK